jgi:enamine deaminase RidA (YjgF/YER057c/UK114 family)
MKLTKKILINPAASHATKGYSQAVRVGNTVYISGQVGLDREGNLVGKDDPVAQARQAVANIKAVLDEVGAGPENIVKMKTYVTDRENWFAILKEIGKFTARYSPAYTSVLVAGLLLPGTVVEIEAVVELGIEEV